MKYIVATKIISLLWHRRVMLESVQTLDSWNLTGVLRKNSIIDLMNGKEIPLALTPCRKS
jgi:hypothetical protein